MCEREKRLFSVVRKKKKKIENARGELTSRVFVQVRGIWGSVGERGAGGERGCGRPGELGGWGVSQTCLFVAYGSNFTAHSGS